MKDINWNALIKAIRYEGAVLFIGPNLEKDEHGIPIFTKLCQELEKKYAGNIHIDDKDGFFFIHPTVEFDVKFDIKEFYDMYDFASDIYYKIAAIPFHLIITLSPDDSLHNIFENNSIPHKFDYFESYNTLDKEPTKNYPLIYNLLGLATQNRYVLTEENYYNYIKSVIGDNVLPKKIISAFSSASNFIFIGFDFDKWYIRLLLMILNFHIKKEGKTRHAIKLENTGLLLDKLIEEQFNITFIKNNDADFVNVFYEKMSEQGLLRELKPKIEVLKKLIIENQQLINKYEENLTLGGTPREEMQWQKAVEELKAERNQLEQNLKTL